MTLSSMTGFARGSGEQDGFRWNWELKSVNNKGLEIRCKLPGFLDGYDLDLKKLIGSNLTRGSVFLNLNIEQDAGAEQFVINNERLDQLVETAERLVNESELSPARIDGLLAIKGVIDIAGNDLSDERVTALKKSLSESLTSVVEQLKIARREEGERMLLVLRGQLAEMKELLSQARNAVGNRDTAMRTRFETQLAKIQNLDKPVPDDRIAQEVAIMAVKSDIQEEFDRLAAHFDEAGKLLSSDKPVGRRLDFLCQEFNREANTLCSKSNDTALTRAGVDLKVIIDQFREQVQNIE